MRQLWEKAKRSPQKTPHFHDHVLLYLLPVHIFLSITGSKLEARGIKSTVLHTLEMIHILDLPDEVLSSILDLEVTLAVHP